jgi:hypothetical protein
MAVSLLDYQEAERARLFSAAALWTVMAGG